MQALHLALFALLGSALVLAIVELGLSAYVVSSWGEGRRKVSFSVYGGYSYHNVRSSTPGILVFLLFASCWTIWITIATAVLPCFLARKSAVKPALNTVLGITFAVVYFATMAFWLAGFADLATRLHGSKSIEYLDAIIAFAVLLWLLFLGLFVLTVLALCGVLVSDWPGYQSRRKNEEAPAPPPASEPVHNVPMSTTPVAPSELSTHDAEALHNQSRSQSHSVSSPSAIASVELSGDSVHHDHNPSRS